MEKLTPEQFKQRYGEQGLQQISASAPTKGENFLKSIGKDAFKTLVVKPATRFGQFLVGSYAEGQRAKAEQSRTELQAQVDDLLKKYKTAPDSQKAQILEQAKSLQLKMSGAEQQSAKAIETTNRVFDDTKVDVPLAGSYDIEGQRAGVSGAKQIFGDALKSASYLYTPGGAASTIERGFAGKLFQATLQGAKTGAVGGSAYNTGQALIDDKPAQEVFKEGVKGSLVGAATGAVVGGGTTAVSAGVKATANGVNRGIEAVKSGVDAVKNKVDDLAANDTSIVGRGIRNVQENIEQRKLLQGKPESIKYATKVGVPTEQAEIVAGTNESTKKQMAKMLDQHTSAQANPLKNARPAQTVGEELVNKAKVLNKARSEAGQKVGELFKSLPETEFAATNTQKALEEGFGELGVKITDDGLDFSNSILTGDKERSILEDAFSRLNTENGIRLNKNNAKIIRDRIFNSMELAAKNGELGSYSQVLFNKIRNSILSDLAENTGKAGKEYAKQSQVYAETLGTLQRFYKVLGLPINEKNMSLAGLRSGEVANRILGNASAKPEAVIDELIQMAKKYGDKSDVDTKMLIYFNDLLEELLGTTQTRSLQGQVNRAGADLFKDVLSGNKAGLLDKAYKGVTGTSKSELIRALKALLNQSPAK